MEDNEKDLARSVLEKRYRTYNGESFEKIARFLGIKTERKNEHPCLGGLYQDGKSWKIVVRTSRGIHNLSEISMQLTGFHELGHYFLLDYSYEKFHVKGIDFETEDLCEGFALAMVFAFLSKGKMIKKLDITESFLKFQRNPKETPEWSLARHVTSFLFSIDSPFYWEANYGSARVFWINIGQRLIKELAGDLVYQSDYIN